MEQPVYANRLPGRGAFIPNEGMDDDRGPGIDEFLGILRRHKVALLLPMVALFAASVAVAYSLPRLYRSTATILIEQQEIPPELVRSTVLSYADERIQSITQRVLTTANLRKIAEKFDLYRDLRERDRAEGRDFELVAERMREDFSVKTVDAQVRDPRTGGARWGTIAFDVSYESQSPVVAQKVAEEMASLYLEENRKTRTQAATDTARFLEEEAERLGTEISELEARIAEFKNAHMGRLPEQLDLNLRLMARTEEQLQQVMQRIRALEDRKIYLQAAMAQVKANPQSVRPNPQEAMSATERLQALRVELIKLSAVYAPDHPDVVRLRKEIEALEQETGAAPGVGTLRVRLDDRRAELARARERYSSQHPDVKKLEREVVSLKAALRKAGTENNARSSGAAAEDPTYIELRAQLKSADGEIQALQAQREELQAKLGSYEERIAETPRTERQYSLLVRDRENLIAKYQEIKAKLSSARIAENLEKDRKGERFSLIEPPRRPTRPFKPNRKKILAVGFLGSVAGGVGTAVITDFLTKAVYGARGVAALLGAPPLAVIPYVENAGDRRRRRWKRAGMALVILTVIAVAVAFVHLRIVPLEVLWTTLPERLEVLWAAVTERLNMLWTTVSEGSGAT